MSLAVSGGYSWGIAGADGQAYIATMKPPSSFGSRGSGSRTSDTRGAKPGNVPARPALNRPPNEARPVLLRAPGHVARDGAASRGPAPGGQAAGGKASRGQDLRGQDSRGQVPGGQVPGGQVSGGNAPSGTIWLHGLHAVAAALANPQRRLRRLLLTEDAESALAARLPPPWPQSHERVDRARLDQLLGRDTVHQGMAALADPLPQPALTALLERPGPVLVLDQVTDPRNVGAILRSAAAFGVAGVIVQDRHAPDETGVLARAASGALETVPMIRAVNLARTLVALKAANLWVVGLAAEQPALRGSALAGRRVALVLGAEGAGLRRLTRDTCDELAGLAMPGTMESLNVSAAATVALYELTRGG